MDKRILTSRAHPANRALVLTLIAVPPPPNIGRHSPCTTRDATTRAVCLSLRGTSATPPGRGGQVLGNNEVSHDAGTVRLLYEETWQAPRPRAHRYRPSGYSRYSCRDFILTAEGSVSPAPCLCGVRPARSKANLSKIGEPRT